MTMYIICVCVCVCAWLTQNLEAMHSNHSKLLQEIEQLNSRLKEVR